MTCPMCEDSYNCEVHDRPNDAYPTPPENVETPKDRLAACHRSGAQIDVGPFTVDRACDLYSWLINGADTRPENVETPFVHTDADGPFLNHEHCVHWRAFGDCCYCYSEPCSLTPENVECQTCGGEGRLVNLDRFGPDYRPCPDCTPENVEEPKLGIAPTNSKFCPTCGGEDLPRGYHPCYTCNGTGRVTPENMEAPERKKRNVDATVASLGSAPNNMEES